MRNKKITSALAFALVCALLASCAAPAPAAPPTETAPPATSPMLTPLPTQTAKAERITPEEAYQSLASAVLLDVRTAQEYESAHIPGAYLLPVEEIDARALAELPQNKPLYIYCRTGRRSALAAEKLVALGFTQVYDLGGIVDWPYETEAGAFLPGDLIGAANAQVVPVQLLDEGEVLPDDEEAEMPDLCGTGDECETAAAN